MKSDFMLGLDIGDNEDLLYSAIHLFCSKFAVTPNKATVVEYPVEPNIVLVLVVLVPSDYGKLVVKNRYFKTRYGSGELVYNSYELAQNAVEPLRVLAE